MERDDFKLLTLDSVDSREDGAVRPTGQRRRGCGLARYAHRLLCAQKLYDFVFVELGADHCCRRGESRAEPEDPVVPGFVVRTRRRSGEDVPHGLPPLAHRNSLLFYGGLGGEAVVEENFG